MNIQEIVDKFKALTNNDAVFNAFLIVLVAVASFGLGRQSAQTNIVQNQENLDEPQVETLPPSTVGSSDEELQYVASVNSDKYHLPWCSGAQRIKADNKIFFDSQAAAEAAGYQPAANCEGL